MPEDEKPPTPPEVRAFLAEAGRKGGKVKSEAKTAAARENARKPRKRRKKGEGDDHDSD